MTLGRKLLLLSSALAALLALSGPAVAQAAGPQWYVGGAKVTTPQSIEMSGTLYSTYSYASINCSIGSWSGTLSNSSIGEGSVTTKPFEYERCGAPSGCEAIASPIGSSWPISTSGPTDVFLQNSGIRFEYVGNCGLVTKNPVNVQGNLKGSFNNATGCIQYSETQTWGFSPEVPWKTSGSLCLTSKGGKVELKQASESPSVKTKAASSVSHSAATLNATVDPEGKATTYQFEYGTTTSYGSKMPASPASAGSGNEPTPVSQKITGLSPNTTYHFRIAATNSVGTSYGDDVTFKTETVGPFWYLNGELVGGSSESEPFTLGSPWTESELSFSFLNGYVNSECEVGEGEGSLWNGQRGEGSIDLGFSECWTSPSPCQVDAIPASSGWPIAVQADGSVRIGTAATPVYLNTEWNGCSSIGIPNGAVILFTGSFGGKFNNSTGCIEFSKSEGMSHKSVGKMLVGGRLCLNPLGEGPAVTLN